MLSLVDGIRHEYFPDLNRVRYDSSLQSLNEWFLESDEYEVARDQPVNELIIDVYDIDLFLKPYARDINRLSCASIESLNNIYKLNTSPKFLGWNITKYYYSAFFSAHCILRLFGRGVLRIEQRSISEINSLAKRYGYTPSSCSSGLYSLELLPANRLRFYKMAIYNDSHKGLWRRFLDFLNEIIPNIYGNLIQHEAQLVVSKIEELKDAICYTSDTKQNGDWLSKMRNLVNYSQGYGVWFPYKGYKDEYEFLFNSQTTCKNEPLSIELSPYRGRDLMYFVRTCQLVNAICFKSLADLKQRHSDNKSFVNYGIYKYHNLYLQRTLLNDGLIT